MIEKSNYSHKDVIDVQRLLLQKATSVSEANKLGNHIFKLQNEKLKWQQQAAGAEKQLLEINIRNNKLDFIR